MSNLKNAPLIYTLGMVQFPNVPDIERFIDSFRDRIRNEYPEYDESTNKFINASIDQKGIKIDEPKRAKIWQFSTYDRKWAFMLTNQALFLHTSSYHDFLDFSKRFIKGILALIEVQNINIKYIKSVGLRYVNLISARKNSTLQTYLQPWVLPSISQSLSFLDVLQSIHVTRYCTKEGELRLQAILNPSFTLPPELNSPFVIKNEWAQEKPKNLFAVVDIDHHTNLQRLYPFDLEYINNNLKNLKKTSKKIFNSIGTEQAMKIWKKQ